MRILHVVPTYLPAWRHGGPVRSVHGLARALVARGHEVTVFTTDVHADGTLDVPRGVPVGLDGVQVWYFPVGSPRRLYRAPALGGALSRSIGSFDVAHLHSLFLWPTWAASRAARRAGVPYVVAPRGMLVADLVRRRGRARKLLWLRLVERRNLEGAAALHATTALEAREAARFGFRLPPVAVVPNGVEEEPPQGPAGEALSPAVRAVLERRPLLLFLGRLSWKKGLERLIAALGHLPDVTLAVAGNDDEGCRPRLEHLARAAGVAPRIAWLGPVAGSDKAALLHGADALVLPSHSENFGNVVVEAMAAGCPAVVTAEVGLADAVRETGSGIVAPGEPPALGRALGQLLADPEARAEMGRRGARAAAELFSWPAVGERMEQVYNEVLANGTGKTA